MTNREMFLLATSILFASTTAGMAMQKFTRPHHAPMGMERSWGGPHGPEGRDGKRPDFLAKSDTNNDGFVTREEMLARQQTRTDELFATVDTDKDGKLSKDEMEKGKELMRDKMRKRFEAERNTEAAK